MKTLEMVSGTGITILDTNSIKILQRCILLLGSKAVFRKLLRSHFSSSSSQVKKNWYIQSIIKFANKYLLPALCTGFMQYVQQHLRLSPTAGDFGNWFTPSKVILEQRTFQFRKECTTYYKLPLKNKACSI